MFRVIALLVVLSYCALAANDPIREVTSQATRAGNQLIPAFYKGYIYWAGLMGSNRQVTIYAPDGHLAFSFETQNGAVESVAIDRDGALAVSWSSKQGGGIDFRDRSGALIRTIQTGTYIASHISFAEDHSLWSLGWQLDAADGTRSEQRDYMTVRRYLEGKEAGGYLPRSLFPSGLEPGEGREWQRSSSINVGHDRVGLWVYSGKSGDQFEWIELDLSGNLLGRSRLDGFDSNTRIAFTTDGHLFVQTRDLNAKSWRLRTLDRPSSAWRELESPPSGRLEGADGDALVFSDAQFGPMHLRWYPHP